MTGYAGAVAKFRYDTSHEEIEPSDLMVILHAPFVNTSYNSNRVLKAELRGSGESDLVHFRGSLYSDVEIIRNEYSFESESIEVTKIGGQPKLIPSIVTLTMSLTFTYNVVFERLLHENFYDQKTIDIGIYFAGPNELQMYHLYVVSLNMEFR